MGGAYRLEARPSPTWRSHISQSRAKKWCGIAGLIVRMVIDRDRRFKKRTNKG
jgi:hypothetical protein